MGADQRLVPIQKPDGWLVARPVGCSKHFQAITSPCSSLTLQLAGLYQDSEGELPLTQPLLRTELDSLLDSTVWNMIQNAGGWFLTAVGVGSGKYVRGFDIFWIFSTAVTVRFQSMKLERNTGTYWNNLEPCKPGSLEPWNPGTCCWVATLG